MVRQFHDGTLVQVLDNGEPAKAFPGTKESNKAASWPTLFSMIFSVILSDAFAGDDETYLKIRYRTDSELCNLAGQNKGQRRCSEEPPFRICCRDTESQMQQSMNNFATACPKVGLTCISTKKKEVSQDKL